MIEVEGGCRKCGEALLEEPKDIIIIFDGKMFPAKGFVCNDCGMKFVDDAEAIRLFELWDKEGKVKPHKFSDER